MKGHIPSLNGLRAISILMVIFYHLLQHHFLPDNTFTRLAGHLLFNGQLGVNIFFVISGFLITSLLMREKAYTGGISLRKFYGRRAIRIFPAYYFLLLVYFILQLLGFIHLSGQNWFSCLTYTRQFFPDSSYETSHLWSMSVEEVFYLIWPLLFMLLAKRVTPVSWVLILIVTIARIFQYAYPVPGLNNTIMSTGDALLVGCLFAIHNDKIKSWVLRYKKWYILIFPALAIAVLIYSYFFYLNTASSKPAADVLYRMQSLAYAFVGNIGLITNLLIGLFIVISINIAHSLWYRFLNLRPMEIIGRLSYSLYLWQQIFTSGKVHFYHNSFFLVMITIFGAAAISYYLIERPFFKLKSKFGFIEAN
ncbi:MAG: acyltransferase [Chitinophagaceae bacterium]